jgi:PAS domain S-box-containing protein
MSSSIRRTLWSAFAFLTVLVITGLALNLAVLQSESRQESRVVRGYGPLIEATQTMDESIGEMISSARGYTISRRSEFQQQHADAVREFKKARATAEGVASSVSDQTTIRRLVELYNDILPHTSAQIEFADQGRLAEAQEEMSSAAAIRRKAPDYAGMLADNERRLQLAAGETLAARRQWLTLLLIVTSLGVIIVAAYAVSRIEQSLVRSINRQVHRTQEMIAGMPDGVMLVDGEGRVIFINPAGQQLLGRSAIGVPIEQQPESYGLEVEGGRTMDPRELPAAQALATGKPVRDTTMFVRREDDKRIAISMSAMPLQEENRTTGVIVTFRDITERRRLEEEMQLQAERAQTIADAGAFFASNIDPVWVTQAIAERVAEALGDWAAVILKSPESSELRVAAIYHREMASLGLAWSYIYRQPLTVGEGIIGQVVASGYPSLTSNPSGTSSSPDAYHSVQMRLSSLLILPLRTRREMLGALVVAAHDPERQMNDQKLPLAEVLAERAALAIENAKLYTEQVEARRKVEDLSRLKDEFLSIASHELRTPVTSIKGYTQLAKTLIKENDLATSEEYLDVALDQIDRMSRLILELLDVSRIETGRLDIRREPIQWSTFVRDVVHRHHTAVSDRRFHLDVPDDDKVVNGDRDRLEQVLGNLLENAVKYSPDGSDIMVHVDSDDGRIVTSVRDRGIGIPSDELNQVFERFHRGRQVSSTNYGGLGLGLYITKQIIERHGGTIWVESREGQGTSFYFSIPEALMPAAAKTA